MKTEPRQTGKAAKRGFRSFRVVLILGVTLCIVLSLMEALNLYPMGTGSKRYARKWITRLQSPHSIEEAEKEIPNLFVRRFDDGSWVMGVCKDSHTSPWGGTVVVRDSNGSVGAFFGHVCGSRFLVVPMNPERRNLEEFYKFFGEGSGYLKFEEYTDSATDSSPGLKTL